MKILGKVANAVELMVAGVLFLGGIETMFSPAIAGHTELQIILGSVLSLVIFGVIYIILGCCITIVRVRNNTALHSPVMFWTFAVSLFSFILEFQIFHTHWTNWLDTCSLTIVTAFLYIRARRLKVKGK